ncbi:transcriptional regulator NrdR [Candidatus Berkelbacteria bacterium CG10_big_fil_rev_8_21_14_0_10_43_13]|uniref:Transcriptional repressor NrdR n=1 Tax=Candidatus Berkelbacteria bacterium CG10_big_fil_rev_8_21_14_0_10_43_13 TaxID=1974514 RepID=A0A2H0W6C8_9BACT|nr:MAG: transcriptional regulator NrdR [Candidatus Berkelbacteria bacterium CG10_big_fil_rev_8_21_14_0_10_43_13]
MFCPECKKSDTRVLDSRDDTRVIRRRRECLRCHYRFTTYERVESPRLKVIKRNGESEDYSRDKLSKGIFLAMEKRPVSQAQIEAILDSIEHEITRLKTKFISSKQMGNFAISKLKEVDEVAYLRFLSVYKSFGSASKFQKEAEKLTKDKPI